MESATRLARPPNVAAVLLLISDLEFGGAQRQVVELANSMDPTRFQVHVCALAPYTPLAEALHDRDRRLHVIERRSKWDFSVVPRLAALIKRLKADIVHAYLFDASISARLAGALVRRVVVVDSERNTDYSIRTRHHVAYRLTRPFVDFTIANSRAGADFRSRLLREPRDSYRVVHNGVDTERFQPRSRETIRRELGLSEDTLVAGMFASFKPQKNHALLLHAARHVVQRFPHVKFLFVGDELYKGMSNSAEVKATINRLVAEFSLAANCVFLGNRQDVHHVYNACDITVLPSLFEGTPNVALESMASGIPIVATDVSDNAYVIPEGRAGYVIPSGDEAALADRICRLLGDIPLARRMGDQARTWILEEFSCKRLAEKTADAYEEFLALRRR